MDLYQIFKCLNINYSQVEHEAVYTVKEAKKLNIISKINGLGCKNLFLKDTHKRYFLVILQEDKNIRINEIAHKIGTTHMSFASEAELMQNLGLISGSVSPFGIINDKDNLVTIVLDSELVDKKLLFHPNRNTATLAIDYADLIKFIKYENHDFILL